MGAYAALKGRSFTAVYTLVCFSAACKSDVKNEPAIAALKRCDTPKSCRKKETGRLGPASGASVEMRLHRSLAPLNQEIVRAAVSRPRVRLAPARAHKERGRHGQRSNCGASCRFRAMVSLVFVNDRK